MGGKVKPVDISAPLKG